MSYRLKTTKSDFTAFKKEFWRCYHLLGLTGWDVSFIWKSLETSFAQVEYVSSTCVATVFLCRGEVKETFNRERVTSSARHEAVHLLLARYDHIASARFTSPEELNQANEEIAVKLTRLLK